MKRKFFILSILIISIVYSCVPTTYIQSPSTYIQVYKATPITIITKNENSLFYEDNNCKLSYNLWAEGGNIGFCFYNKTDQFIYINLEECFFVLNGIANNYYKNRVFTSSSTSGNTTSQISKTSNSLTGFIYSDFLQTNSFQTTNRFGLSEYSGFSVSFNEEKVVCIPAKTSKIITEYTINEILYRDCFLFKYPSSDQIKSKSFSKEDSPLVFSNMISYSVGKSGKQIRFKNEFFVSEISNYPESEITAIYNDLFCGQVCGENSKHFINVSPDKFYIKYVKRQDYCEH